MPPARRATRRTAHGTQSQQPDTTLAAEDPDHAGSQHDAAAQDKATTSQQTHARPSRSPADSGDAQDDGMPATPEAAADDGVDGAGAGGGADPDNDAQLPSSTFSARNERDHVKIMLATDNHVGYMERDPVRGQDSIRTFEEILQLAVEHQVDLILLGGDLFHENKPSRATLHQVMALLRQYTLGDRPIQVELLSDPNDGALPGFDFPAVNYEDQNLNVSIPVFSIHGNHDDPQGTGETGALSALDLLSVSGLINYFGKVELPSDDATAAAPSSRAAKGSFQEKGIRIKPVLLQKGNTKLALYGMGNIKDERMHFELRANRVRMFRPQEDPDSWFNILCVHQNRVAHNPKACVPETMFDDSVHLVVWGHEHEQLILPQSVAEKRYHITQPGSSIATSLMPGEAVEKCVAIIHVENTDFLIEPIPLKTVRPFVMDDLRLDEELEEHGLEPKRGDIMKLLRMRVNELIDKARQEFTERFPDREMPLPLIRLRVEYVANQEISNPQRFGQEFNGKVANPKDVLQFTKRRAGTSAKDNDASNAYVDVTGLDLLPAEKLERVDVGKLVQEYLQAQNLDILNPEGLEGAVVNFVEKDDKDAIDSFVKKMLRNTVKGLVTIDPEEAQLQNELERLRQEQQRGPRAGGGSVEDDDDEDGHAGPARSAAASSRRKQAPAASTSRRGGKAAARDSDESMMDDLDADEDVFDDDDDEDEDDGRAGAKGRGGSRASPKKASRGKSATTAGGRAAASTPPKTRAAPTRRAAAKAAEKTFLGPSDDEDDEAEFVDRAAPEDVIMIDDDDDEPEPTPAPGASRHAAALGLSTSRTTTGARGKKATASTPATAKTRAAPAKKAAATGLRQSQLSFGSRPATATRGRHEEVDDGDEDEFEEPTSTRSRAAASASTRKTATRR
ncbi:uncharacterized protein PFL1_04420 [Pseudozyma flocculosa PF-1]|uniref:Related to MRE11 - DNA repair and meiotic recombination protein n=2 Tax=Pseudozyma flocculosa TaxID=84751 RepID=A0A5C3FEI7_9BASI|nr:uncharacterized protein PFL1_04420 [Pseudozyma flocculosa PF-1]EPQ28093.1 hypothetical protein PFL1_04420 [Pseudozyma flocculosa PF-1]SPO41891.1 related to MRE11 - DNA repair and meiotic recombination protein [Pseudozyma flocculosa]